MTTNDTTPGGQSLAHPWSARRRHTVIWLLYAALAVQLAAWIAIVQSAGNLGSAFTQPQPGFPANMIAGGAIWLVMFALSVLGTHWRLSRYDR